MRRGELYSYVRPSTPEVRRTVVILSGDPDDLLAVPVGDGRRFAYVGDLGRLYRAWIGRRVGHLDATTLVRLDGAVRAALEV